MQRLLTMTLGLFTTLTLVAALFAAAPSGARTLVRGAAGEGGKTLDGKEIFLAQKCNLCHAVEVAGIEAVTKSEKMKGPDLTGKAAELDADWLAKYLRKAADKDGEEHKKEFKGSDEELGALIAWLQAQKKKDGE